MQTGTSHLDPIEIRPDERSVGTRLLCVGVVRGSALGDLGRQTLAGPKARRSRFVPCARTQGFPKRSAGPCQVFTSPAASDNGAPSRQAHRDGAALPGSSEHNAWRGRLQDNK